MNSVCVYITVFYSSALFQGVIYRVGLVTIKCRAVLLPLVVLVNRVAGIVERFPRVVLEDICQNHSRTIKGTSMYMRRC